MPISSQTTLRVVVPSVRMYLKPENDEYTDTQILFGEEVQSLDEHKGGFTKIFSPVNEKEGWIKMAASVLEPTKTLAPPTHWVAMPRIPVYAAPDAKSARISVLPMNARIAAGLTGRKGQEPFTQVQCLASGSGWVRSSLLLPIDESLTDFVAVQEQFLGTLYGWGERDAHPGIDCSALVMQSLLATGWETCPRDTKDQVESLGEPLDGLLRLKRGDLVFWKGHVVTMQNSFDCIHSTDLAPHHRVLTQPLSQVIRERDKAGLGEIVKARRFPEYAF